MQITQSVCQQFILKLIHVNCSLHNIHDQYPLLKYQVCFEMKVLNMLIFVFKQKLNWTNIQNSYKLSHPTQQ